jgi:hypothetical protein
MSPKRKPAISILTDRMRMAIQNDDAAQARDAVTKPTFEARDKVVTAP